MKSTNNLSLISIPGLVYQSAKMCQLAEDMHRLSRTQFPILLTGESGTGKELVARAMHALSPRRQQGFVAYNCSAVPPYLMESELFGHKRGSFTGAIANASGVIRAADGGTLLLDEIGDLLVELQPKLLRFLQEGEIHVVGESQPRKVDVRLIAATNHNLAELVAAKKFRTDLYYRLNIVELHLPPLRERAEDIPFLIHHFLKLYGAQEGKPDLLLSEEAMETLLRHHWPGNVRELSNVLQRAVALAEAGSVIELTGLPPKFQPPAATFDLAGIASLLRAERDDTPLVHFPAELCLAEIQTRLEYELLQEALRRHQGNQSLIAKDLRLQRSTLRKKLQAHGLLHARKKPTRTEIGQKLTRGVAATQK